MNQTPDLMEELIRLCQTLECPAPISLEDGEEQLCDAVWRKDWDRTLELLDRIPGPVSRKTASICLSLSLHSASSAAAAGLLQDCG